MYLLKNKREKNEIHYKQTIKKDAYTVPINFSDEEMNPEQDIKARKYFFPYLKGVKLPGRPDGNVNKGFYFQTDDFVAFKGLGKDASLFFHLLIVPTLKHGYDRDSDTIILKNCSDIKEKHKTLLFNMKKHFCCWVQLNKQWFYDTFDSEDVDFWLKPENFHFGFHWPPSIGYLHLHAMVGPITKHGFYNMVNRWVDLKDI